MITEISENQIMQALPFNGLNDFHLQIDFDNCRQRIDSILDAKGLNYFIENLNLRDLRCNNIEHIKYLDLDGYQCNMEKIGNRFSLFHLNIRMSSKHNVELISYLDLFQTDLDIIVLSEIGKEGFRYLQSTFPYYSYTYDIPEKNKYGGVAIMLKKKMGHIVHRNDLKVSKTVLVMMVNLRMCGFN